MSSSGSRTLTVKTCESGYTGTNKKGESYTIYNVTAVDADGNDVTQKLNSFEPLPVGEQKTYKITGPTDTKAGPVWTLSLPRAGSSLGPKVDELRAEVKDLRERIERLESRSNGPAVAESAGATKATDATF